MNDKLVNQQQILSVAERISKFTVGIAAENNTAIGTGTLVAHGKSRYVLTAEHVIRGVDPTTLKFWCRPDSPIIEKAAADATIADIGRLTEGISLPIDKVELNVELDVALLEISPTFELPSPCEYYDLSRSQQFMVWPESKLDGCSLMYFGFPVQNSQVLAEEGNKKLLYLGCAYSFCHYDSDLNRTLWNRIHHRFSAERDFLMKYEAPEGAIHPGGFSGCGIWLCTQTPDQQVWQPDPMLIGVMKQYLPTLDTLIATKIPQNLTVLNVKSNGKNIVQNESYLLANESDV